MNKKPTYCTVAQVSNLLNCKPQAINSAISRGQLQCCYPFPDDFIPGTDSGPKCVVVNNNLRVYLTKNKGNAALIRGNINYNPVKILERYCDYADADSVAMDYA